MGNAEGLTPVRVGVAYHATPAVASDVNFDTRWAAWIERGRAHDQRVRGRLAVWTAAITTGAAIVYAFLRS